MQTVDQLNESFGIAGLLGFDEPHPGMPRARVVTPACAAELYLQGAHLTHWQPTGEEPVLFVSGKSAFVPGKAIRGGIPVIFPWFGAPERSPVHPPPGSASHGVARNAPWSLRFAALAGEDLHLSLTLDPTETLQQPGFDGLQLGLDLVLGAELTLRLTAAYAPVAQNAGPILVEEALHAYFRIGDVSRITLEGLGGTEFLDKTEDFARKTQVESSLQFTGETDRPYLNTTAPVTLTDPVLGRQITLTKSHSQSTVVWNPGEALAAKLSDLAPNDWQRFACMETSNVAENAIRLLPGEAHTMGMHLAVAPL